MKPANHRIITLAEAIDEFNIEAIFGADFEDIITDRIDEDAEVLVFDGDTEFTGDIQLESFNPIAYGEPYDYSNHELIIVNGNLRARNINMWQIAGLLVLGDMTCEKILLRESFPFYAAGNLVANQAILAIAGQEGYVRDYTETLGPMYANVRGTASSPRVQTWFMPLQHLNWAAGSGKEYAEDVEHPGKDNWVSDPIWKF